MIEPVRRAVRAPAVLASIVVFLVALFGCATPSPPPLDTTPTFEPKTAARGAPAGTTVVGQKAQSASRVALGPAPPPGPTIAGTVPKPRLPQGMLGEGLALEQVPLPQFIDEVFTKTLKLNVQIDQAVMHRTDLVTLRSANRLSASELIDLAEKILAGYGIGVSWDGQILHVAPHDALMAQMPTLIRSRALPDISAALRPVFQIVDLHQVSANDMMTWLANSYGSKVKLFAAPAANAIMIFGLPDDVAAVVEAASVLDQPRLAGHLSLRFSPIYWTAQALAAKLAEVLRAEGYGASVSSANATGIAPPAILLVPVEANNSLLAFAADRPVLAHIEGWVSDLDKPGQVDPSRNIFIYQVENTTAASLGATAEAVLTGRRAGPAGTPTPEVRLEQAGQTSAQLPSAGFTPGLQGATAPATPADNSLQTASASSARATAQGSPQSGPRLVIDQARNTLIFVGTAQDYSQIRPLLEVLDKPQREALIEVTVAEVDLTNSSDLGVTFSQSAGLFGGSRTQFGTGSNVLSPLSSTSSSPSGSSTSGVGVPIGTTGFNLAVFNNIGDARILLNAFAEKTKVTVLSTPRIVAKSGGEARIDVGTQVPIITSQGSTNTIQNNGTTGILQSIEYIQTGVLLAVNPVIHSGNQIDLKLSQEVSNAIPNPTPGISSPQIQNRKVQTQVTLTDGQTAVIGGMITENRTDADSGVPYLKDVPGLGLLFGAQSPSKQRVELLVFITPYVISDANDSKRITQQFQQQMQRWPTPSGDLHW